MLVYGDIFLFILPLLLIERLQQVSYEKFILDKLVYVTTWIQILSISVMTLGYTYMDNAAYMKGEIAQEQTIAYFNQLITAIKTCDGFDQNMDIVLVGWSKLDDATFTIVDPTEALDAVKIEKFPRYTKLVSYEGSIYFMREHLGFGNEKVIVDDGTVADEAAVKSMPTYPDDGAIAVVDGRVIVKLGE